MRLKSTLILVTLMLPAVGDAQPAEENGRVQLPLDVYQDLIERATEVERPAPVGYALGRATINAQVREVDERATAQLSVTLSIEVLEDEWTLIPVLPAGVGVDQVTVDGNGVSLSATPIGLCWSTEEKGSHTMVLSYRVDATRSEAGFALAVPTPAAAVTTMTATLPGVDLDVGVIPAAGVTTTNQGRTTQIRATIPTTSGLSLSWRLPTEEGHVISRAQYAGTLRGHAVAWTVDFSVELLGAQAVTLDLLPKSVTLSGLTVDGKPGTILVNGNQFATLLKGRGVHRVRAEFEVPVATAGGPPHVVLPIPPVPVSRFDLTLPGKKEVSVEPAANVTSVPRGNTTVATVFVPMTSTVKLTWNEAVPEAIKTELRANASLYHAAHAEEGVLYVRAMTRLEVTRGETNRVTLEVPPGLEINTVAAPSGGVSDWRFTRGTRGRPGSVQVFLDRQVQGEFTFEVACEKLIGTGAKTASRVTIPLLSATNVHRQRGMVALLASKELTLKPVEEAHVTRVGENQLPAFVRQAIDKTIAHTFKYTEEIPSLVVEPTEPERKQGKFDAEVNTLISLSDVTLKGSATVEVNVKSGSIMDLQLALPVGVNFLDRAAPSLRTHKIIPGEDAQTIDLQFTQEMEGQFRVKVTYERILADGENEIEVPTLSVRGAEVEQGRIAVEALTAVEVQPATVEQLSSLDVNELPQQLILETTNPILLAYKYVHIDPPYKLGLKIARHQELDVQSATIDQAHYRTLFTRDGLAVTTARFTVRNSRKQFLKVALPEGSKVWSVFVDGQPEKPALATAEKDSKKGPPQVLIKIINSSEGFPIDLIYATPISKVSTLGTIGEALPRPDMIVTQSTWDVYLPDGLSYYTPSANMDLVERGVPMTREAMQEEVAGAMDESAGAQMVEPLRLSVPTAGIRYRFEKLYANQADEDAYFSIPYSSGAGAALAHLLTLLGTVLFWLGLFFVVRRHSRVPLNFALGAIGVGVVVMMVTIGYLGTSPALAILLSLLAMAGGGAYLGRAWYRRRRAASA